MSTKNAFRKLNYHRLSSPLIITAECIIPIASTIIIYIHVNCIVHLTDFSVWSFFLLYSVGNMQSETRVCLISNKRDRRIHVHSLRKTFSCTHSIFYQYSYRIFKILWIRATNTLYFELKKILSVVLFIQARLTSIAMKDFDRLVSGLNHFMDILYESSSITKQLLKTGKFLMYLKLMHHKFIAFELVDLKYLGNICELLLKNINKIAQESI